MQAKKIDTINDFSFLNKSGEVSELIKSIDWAKNPLGEVKYWPVSLRTTLSIIMHSKFPMFLFWGKDLICFYNDAYRPSLGNTGKHPSAMGQKAKDCWNEIWEFLEPILKNILSGEESALHEDELVPIFRNDKTEDVYWTFCHSLVNDDNGNPAGVFLTCSETSTKIKIIRDSKNELEFAINAAELGTWELNPTTNIITMNGRMKDWFGLKENTNIDLLSMIDIIDEKDKELVSETIKKSFEFSSGGAFNIDYKIINNLTKQERVVRSKGKVFFNDKQEPYLFSGILQDITQEMISRQALIDSENNFKKLVERAPVAICVLKGPEFIITVANTVVLNSWNKTKEEVINKPIFSVVPESYKQGFEKILSQVYTTGERKIIEELPLIPFNNRTQEILYFNLVYEAILDKYGKIDGIMGVAINVTEQVNSRRKIEDAEERLRLAIEASNLGVYDLDMITNKLITSPRGMFIFGFDKQSTVEESLMAIHPDDRLNRTEAFEKSLITGKLFYEVRVIWENKDVHWIRVEGRTYKDADNKPIRALGTILDITDQRNAEDELMKINQRLAIALEAGQLGSYEYNLESGEIKASKQFKINYGINNVHGPLFFKDVIALLAPEYQDKVRKNVENAIENKSVYNVEYQVQWPDKSFHWIKSSAKASYNDKNKAIALIGVTIDITELKRQQQQKDDFIGFASHELKTPVTTIKAYSQMLEEILLQNNQQQEAMMVTKIGVQVKRLNNLISDLLDVTKINSGKLLLTKSTFNFNDLIKSIVDDVQQTAPKFNIIQDLSSTDLIHTDKERVVQVTTNLISNAIKYSPNSNKIIVQTSQKENEISVCIKDFGVGIDRENQAKLFDQFYRVSGNMQHTFPGLGLGLYISSEIIKQLGGRIWVNSNIGEGANFCFTLPIIKLNDFSLK